MRCDMRFASYPLDRQECHFKIGSVFAEDDEEVYSGNWTVLDQAGPAPLILCWSKVAWLKLRLAQPLTTFFWPAAYSSMFIPLGRSGTDWTSTRNCKSSSLLKDYSWHLAGDTTVQNMCFIETGYKVTAYKVNSDIKWSFNSPNFPLMTKFWSFIIIKLICI